MSHRDDCPTRWEANREGERAFERGYASFRNPYKSYDPEEGCPEAAREWDSGYRSARYQAETREEERHARRMQEEEYAEEQAYYQMQEEQHYAELARHEAEASQAGDVANPSDSSRSTEEGKDL